MSKLLTNTTDLQEVLEALSDKAVASPVLQDKTVAPSTSQQTITADSGYDGLDTVTVNAMPTTTQATPSIAVNSNGLITATTTQTAGYITAGTKSATKQLTTQAAKTVTPTTSKQTAVASGMYTTGVVTVGAIPSSYIVPSGTKTITTNGTYDVKSYASTTVNVAGGGGAETVTITLNNTSSAGPLDCYLTTLNGYESCTVYGLQNITKQCIKNSLLVVSWVYLSGCTNPNTDQFYENLDLVHYSLSSQTRTAVLLCSQDGTISINSGDPGAGGGGM